MNHLFCTNNNINVNNKQRICQISLTGCVKENGGILLLFLNKGAVPSSSHFPNHDGISCIIYCIVNCRLCGPPESLREESIKNLWKLGLIQFDTLIFDKYLKLWHKIIKIKIYIQLRLLSTLSSF